MNLRALWRKMWRITIGTIVVIVGIILIPLPGPGWLIVFAGLTIMADEFPPARWLLQWARARFDSVKGMVVERSSRKSTADQEDEVSGPS